jgi:hypothetical protein
MAGRARSKSPIPPEWMMRFFPIFGDGLDIIEKGW